MTVLLDLAVLGLITASIAVAIACLRRYASGRTLIAWQPRRPVPWLWWGAVPAVAITAVAIANALAGPSAEAMEIVKLSDSELLTSAITTTGFHIALLALLMMLMVQFGGATRHDLGLPSSAGQLAGDVGLGLLVTLAAFVPIYIVQIAAVAAFGDRSHPLLEMLLSDPRPMVLLVSGVTAVVVAPLLEELVYRLLLQGALERWELSQWSWRDMPAHDGADHAVPPANAVDSRIELEPAPSDDAANPHASPQAVPRVPAESPPLAAPPSRGFGVGSIVVSSLLFALAHAPQWPSPLALFVLALMLGYVYQRTHRIVPSIVAHAAFNATSVALALASMEAGRGP